MLILKFLVQHQELIFSKVKETWFIFSEFVEKVRCEIHLPMHSVAICDTEFLNFENSHL